MSSTDPSHEAQEQTLAREIIADAQRRADRATQRAEREKRKILDAAARAVASDREATLADAQERAASEKRLLDARIEQAVQNLRRSALQSILDRVRHDAEKKLAELAAAEEGRDALVRLAVLAIRDMSGHRFELVLAGRDRERWGADLPANVAQAAHDKLDRDVEVTLGHQAIETTGGLVVRSGDGRQIADQTFETRLDRLWDQICGELFTRKDWDELAPWTRAVRGDGDE